MEGGELHVDRHGKDTWTVFKIMGEFVEGFETLRPLWPSVSIFGSARAKPGQTAYQDGTRIAEALSKAGYSIITGGGSGVMEAANMGARRGEGRSIGLNIKLPEEQSYDILATGFAGHHAAQRRGVLPGTPDIVLVLRRALTISGKVLDEQGKPVPAGVGVFAFAPDAPSGATGGLICWALIRSWMCCLPSPRYP